MRDDNRFGTCTGDDGINRLADFHVFPVVVKFFSAIEANDVSPFV